MPDGLSNANIIEMRESKRLRSQVLELEEELRVKSKQIEELELHLSLAEDDNQYGEH